MYQLVYPTLLLSIAFRLWQIYLPKIVRQCGQLSSSLPGSAVHLWWAMMIGWVIWVEISGQSDILVLADVPHPLQIRIALNMNPIEQNHFKRGHQVHFTILPPPSPVPLSDSMPEQETVNFNFKWIWIYGLEPHLPPLTSPQKNEMLIFGLCLFLMIGWAGQWTRTLSTTPLQPEKWNVHFAIMFNFWWWARLVDGLEPCLPPLSSQKKWNDHFWITFNFWWWAGLVNGLKPHPSPLSSQKNEMLIFGLCSTSDDWLGCLMDSNPIHHPSPAKKWNAHSWIMFNFWWLAGLLHGLEPHPPPLSSQKVKCSFLD